MTMLRRRPLISGLSSCLSSAYLKPDSAILASKRFFARVLGVSDPPWDASPRFRLLAQTALYKQVRPNPLAENRGIEPPTGYSPNGTVFKTACPHGRYFPLRIQDTSDSIQSQSLIHSHDELPLDHISLQ